MKKTISLLLVFVLLASMVSSFAGCGHTHEFVLSETESKPLTCEEDGLEVKICSCGERQETVLTATGHDMRVAVTAEPSCTETGAIDYRCSKCGKMKYTNVDATGHNYEENPSEPSRVIRCLNENCTSCKWGESNGKHTEALTFNFTKEDEAAIDAKYEEVKALIEAAPKYDPAEHGYAEEGALAEEFKVVDDKHTELYELILNAISQRQLAEVAYYCDMDNKELEETHAYMLDYHTNVVAKFYTLSRPFYDSCYRDFYYYGMTEEEINAFLFDSDAVSNPEYTALKEANNEIETRFLALSESEQASQITTLYAAFAANNNKMAQLMGYDNYLEYAYENVYGRDYTYQDAAQLAEYVKTYISPAFNAVYDKWNELSPSQADIDTYYLYVSDPFFENLESNTAVNDYIDLLAFTSNPDKQITFSDEFNKLMGDGNMFRGDYEGAFVTTITSVDLPIAYFGKGYDNAFTITHEFGHYMNEVYSADVAEEYDEFDQSYDLLEMHSQGNELLFLTYLKENKVINVGALSLVETYSLVNMLYSVMAGMTIDTFEQAIYLNKYEGTNADTIMEDGKITANEYNLLYTSICTDYGVAEAIDGYWQYGMTITSPCYYISYSVSALSVLQVYEMANTDGFDVAKDAYLKLFTYVDEDPEMTMEEILTYAGMLSFKDEQLYINMNQYFLK